MKRETRVLIIKGAVGLVAAVTASVVATAVINNIVPIESMTKFDKVVFKVGTLVISSMISQAGADYAGTILDDVLQMFKSEEVPFSVEPA